MALARIESLLHACPDRVVLVDEGYVDFGGESALPLIDRYPNLLVVQTLSKSRSLAGLRVGCQADHRRVQHVKPIDRPRRRVPVAIETKPGSTGHART